MKIFKSQYGWSTTAHSKSKDGEQMRCFMDCQFKRDEEPIGDEIEGELIFRGADGTERNCFFSSYPKQGVMIPKLVLMGHTSYQKRGTSDTQKSVQTVLSDGKKDILGHTEVEIDPEELPFY